MVIFLGELSIIYCSSSTLDRTEIKAFYVVNRPLIT